MGREKAYLFWLLNARVMLMCLIAGGIGRNLKEKLITMAIAGKHRALTALESGPKGESSNLMTFQS